MACVEVSHTYALHDQVEIVGECGEVGQGIRVVAAARASLS